MRDTTGSEGRELTHEERLDALRKLMQEALLGTIKEDRVFIVDSTLGAIKDEIYSKEELGLTDENISDLKAFLKAWEAKQAAKAYGVKQVKIRKINDLYRELLQENKKTYLLRPRKKKKVLREKALHLKDELAAAKLRYEDCSINEEIVEKFANS